ncbi:MAG: hypothetical protein AAGL96_18455 [Pseudomonadota bacterium]
MRFVTSVLLLGALALAGCALPPEIPYASDDRVKSLAWRAPGPPTLTVFTMVNNRTGKGQHTALMINGSQRVIFDPAGSFVNARVAEQEDVLYGVTPAVLAGYKSAHARNSHHVLSQTVEVTPQQAETALALAVSNGAVPRAYCTNATTGLLRQVPGFADVRQSFFPDSLREDFAARADVRSEQYFEDDEGTIQDGIAALVIGE